MHRLLIAFKHQATVVYSINKHQVIQTVERKKVLSADWIPPKAQSFAILTASGFIETYKAESDSQQALNIINLNTQDLRRGQIFVQPILTADKFSEWTAAKAFSILASVTLRSKDTSSSANLYYSSETGKLQQLPAISDGRLHSVAAGHFLNCQGAITIGDAR